MLETINNNCVVIPHLPNWTNSVKHKRTWATAVASGVNGSEDRAAGRTAPLRKITYTVTTILGEGPAESEILAERIKAALQTGRAVCPLYGRAQAVRPGLGGTLEALGLWPWVAGEWCFLTLPQHDSINQRIPVDVGGLGYSAIAGWEPEANFTHSGGAPHSTANEIDISGISEYAVPPQSVLQTARAEPGATDIRFLVNVAAGYPVKVRLWFAFFEPTEPVGTYRILINNNLPVVIDPWAACGSTNYKAGFVDVPCRPGIGGELHIHVWNQTARTWTQVNAIEVFSTCWNLVKIASVVETDVKTLTFAPGDITLADLADVPQVYPVLFGKLGVGDMTAITNWHGEVEISVAEPMGDPVQGILGLTQTELCGIPIDPPPPPPEPEYPREWFGSRYVATSQAQADSLLDGAKAILLSEWTVELSARNQEMLGCGGIIESYRLTGGFKWEPDTTVDTHPAALALANKVEDGSDRWFARSGDCYALNLEYEIISIAQPATNGTNTSFTANWTAAPGASGYRLDVSTSEDFETFVAGFEDLDVGNVLSYDVAGLGEGSSFYYRIRAYNDGGTSDNSATILAIAT